MEKKKVITAVFGIFLLALVGATVVSYLSNMATAEVNVESPMQNQLSLNGADWADTIAGIAVYGGETATIYAKTTNLANVAITGTVENAVTNADGITCADFTAVNVTTTTYINGTPETPDGPYDLIALHLCTEQDPTTVVFSYGPTPIVWGVGQEDISTIDAVFNQGALGTYYFGSQVVVLP